MKRLAKIKESLELIYYAIINPIYGLFLFCRNIGFYLRHPGLLDLDFLFFYYYNFFYSQSKYLIEKQATKKADITELTYGETPYLTLKKILDCLKIKKTDVFYDLGCGRGKLVFFVNKIYKIKAKGIDLIPTYIKVADKISKLKKYKNIEFIEKDFLNYNFLDGTIFFISWTCLSDETVKKVLVKLETIKPGSYVISTSFPIKSEKFKLIKAFKLPFSWGFGRVYLQQKIGSFAN